MPILDLISDPPALLSIALIDPDDLRREEVARALSEFPGTTVKEHAAFPGDLDDLPLMLEQLDVGVFEMEVILVLFEMDF